MPLTIMLGRVLQDKNGKMAGHKKTMHPLRESFWSTLYLVPNRKSCQRICTLESTKYIKISNYLCTITYKCLENVSQKKDLPLQFRPISVSLEDAGCLDFILTRKETTKVMKYSLTYTFNTSQCWVTIGKLALNDKEKNNHYH